MSFVESVLYGFVSGLTEIFPVSSRAHQALLRYLFGAATRNSFQELLVHIGVLLAIFVCCADVLSGLRLEQTALTRNRRRSSRAQVSRNFYDLRLLKTAAIALVIGLMLYILTSKFEKKLLLLLLFWLLNGIFLLLADHTSRGNRDSRTMSGLDGIVMGIAGALEVFPGISRTGMISAYAAARGADSQNVVNWAVLLGIPAMLLAGCFDVVGIVSNGFQIVDFAAFLGCVASGLAAFGGAYFAISLYKSLLDHSGFAQFAYYSIGAALFSFVLYLIT